MTPFDWIIVIGGICGLCMVIGGMVLLYKGVITLSQASPEEAVSLEFKKMIKITTHYPSLGLFVIGLAFVIVSMVFSKSELRPLTIQGHVNVADPASVAVSIISNHDGENLKPLTGGEINGIIYPTLKLLRVEITAPGYDPPTIAKAIGVAEIKKGSASLGEINFANKKVEKPQISPENIMATTAKLPPLKEGGRF
jgi:hypothetical protein